jgi:hypothetical protein
VAKGKVTAEPKIAEETTNSKVNNETKEEFIKDHESTVLHKFVENSVTEVPVVVITHN